MTMSVCEAARGSGMDVALLIQRLKVKKIYGLQRSSVVRVEALICLAA